MMDPSHPSPAFFFFFFPKLLNLEMLNKKTPHTSNRPLSKITNVDFQLAALVYDFFSLTALEKRVAH